MGKPLDYYAGRGASLHQGTPQWKQALEGSQPLTREQEAAVCARIRAGDQSARGELAAANLRFVATVAAQFQGGPVSMDDLVGAGHLGLMKAVDRFDPDRGFKFISFAVWWIKQTIREEIRTRRAVSRPHTALTRSVQVQRTATALMQELHREPTADEVRAVVELNPSEYSHSLYAGAPEFSLDSPAGEDGYGRWLDNMPDPSVPDPDESMDAESISAIVSDAIETLDARRAYIVKRMYGFGTGAGSEPWSLDKCGERLGITRERVRQLKVEAVIRLRAELERRGVHRLVPFLQGSE